MNKKVIGLIGMSFLVGSISYASPNKLNIENVFKKSDLVEKNTMTAFSLKYQNIGSTIEHNETSTTSNYSTLGKTSKIGINNLSIDAYQEFFKNSYISFAIGARYGTSGGEATAKKDEFEESAYGTNYGAGISLNLNTEGFGLRVQPFYSSYYMFSNNTYKLNYTTANSDNIKLKYQEDTKSIQHSLGVRFINPRKSLMSFVSVDYLQSIETNSDTSGTVAGNNIDFGQTSEVENNDIAFSLGVGFVF